MNKSHANARPGRRLEIFYAVDDAYVVPLMASMAALSETNHHAGLDASVTVLTNNVSSSRLQLIQEFGQAAFGLNGFKTVDISRILPSDLPLQSPHNTYITDTAYARFLVPSLVESETVRALYLDADTLVKGDLSELLTTDLCGKPVAAVQDHIISTVGHPQGLPNWTELGLRSDTPYFNSGVLLFDTAAWRSEQLADRIYDYCRQRGSLLEMFDQEAMNAQLNSRIHQLDSRYNVFTNHLCNETIPGEAPLQRDPLSPEEFRRATIVHYVGHLKPWKPGDTPSAETALFFESLDRTPLSGWRVGDFVAGGR